MIAYVARDLGTGRTLSAREDVPLPSYSTIKVLVAATFWRLVARGALDEATPYSFEPGSCVGGSGALRGLRHAAELSLADIMHLALVVSDNDATNIIASVDTSWEHDVGNGPVAFLRQHRRQHRLHRTIADYARVFLREHHHSGRVTQMASVRAWLRKFAYAVVNDHPTVPGQDRWSAAADF